MMAIFIYPLWIFFARTIDRFGKGIRTGARDAMTIGIEMGIQNAGLAILIGDVLLANHEISKPALLYAMFSFWTTAAFAWWAS